MKIDKNWRIESDSMNITLQRRKVLKNKTTGEPYDRWVVEGYFSTVTNALHELVALRIRETKLTDLRTVEKEIETLHKLIEKIKPKDVRR